jgi:hypothetical protein
VDDADPDPDATFHFDGDPDLDPDTTPSFTHLENQYFFSLSFYLPRQQAS